jgi:hypothetical protein
MVRIPVRFAYLVGLAPNQFETKIKTFHFSPLAVSAGGSASLRVTPDGEIGKLDIGSPISKL